MADVLKPYRERLAALRAEQDRGKWRAQWEKLAEFILPRHGRFVLSNPNDGGDKQSSIIDSTASHSARILASGLMSGLTSPARPWFRLTTPDPELAEFGPVKEYLYQTQRRMEIIFARSNFYNVLPACYESLGVFGVGSITSFEDFRDLVRFRDHAIGSYYFGVSSRGVVDTLYRELNYTVMQMVQEFGIARCSQRVREMYERGQVDKWVEIVHAIEPNDKRVQGSPFADGKPIRSVWYEKINEIDQKPLRASGFFEFPSFCPRWWVNGEDIYGHSAGMEVLSDVLQLQFMEGRKLAGIEKLANPPVRAHPDLRNATVSMLPGGVSFAVEGGIEAVYQVDPKLDQMLEEENLVRNRIKSGMFEDLFLMLAQIDRSQITAYEIAERKEEKLLMLGPVLERLNDELLDPVIDRVFAMAERVGFLPPPPEELEGQELRVEYISVLAQAQRAVGVGSIDRFTTAVTAWSQFNPSVLDKWDADQTVDELGELLGVPPKIIRSDDQVEQVRAERAQQQATERLAAMAEPVAKAAKDASQAPVEGDTAFTRALSTVGAV